MNQHTPASEKPKSPDKAALMDFLKDHAKHFGCLPGDFEDADGTVYNQDDYAKHLTDQDHKVLSKLMASKVKAGDKES